MYNASSKESQSGGTESLFKGEVLGPKEIFDKAMNLVDPASLTAKRVAEDNLNQSLKSATENEGRTNSGRTTRTETKERVIHRDTDVPAEGEYRDAPYKESDLDDAVKLREISESALDMLGFEKGKEVRVGFMRRLSRGKALGWYLPRTGEVRIENMNDLGVLMHELGHKLDLETFKLSDKLDVVKDPIIIANDKGQVSKMEDFRKQYGDEAVDGILHREKMRKEIVQLAKDSGHLGKSYKPDQYTKEAIAEYIRMYVWGVTKNKAQKVTIPDLKAAAPEFTAYFEALMESNQRFKNMITNVKSDIADWKKLPLSVRSSQKIRGRTGFGDKPPPITTQIKEGLSSAWDAVTKYDYTGNLVFNFVDDLVHWRRLSQQIRKINPDLNTLDDPLYLKLSALGSAGKAAQFVHNSPFMYERGTFTDAKGKTHDVTEIVLRKDVKPFFKIIDPLIKRGIMTGVEDYLVNRRNIEFYKRREIAQAEFNEYQRKLVKGEVKRDENQEKIWEKEISLNKKATNTRADAERVIRDKEERYGKDTLQRITGEIKEYQDALLDYYKDAGMLSYEALTHIRELNQDYVPFRRYLDYLEDGKTPGQAMAAAGKAEHSKPGVVGLKVSKEDIKSEVLRPRETILENTTDLIRRADKNRALVALKNALDAIDPTIIGQPITSPEGLAKKKDNMVIIYENGVPKGYEIHKPVFKRLFKDNTNPTQAAALIKLLEPASSLLKKGAVTYNVEFLIKNPIRDQVTGTMNSRFGYNPLDYLVGLTANMGKQLEITDGKVGKLAEMAEIFKASGAEQAMLTNFMRLSESTQVMDPGRAIAYNSKKAAEFERAVEGRDMDKIASMMERDPQSAMNSWADRYKKAPWEMIADANMTFEMATRTGAFIKAYKKSGDVLKAMKEGRELVADYSIAGAMTRPFTGLYPFLNANIQHEYMIFRTFKSGRIKDTALAGLTYITAPAVMSWVWNNFANGDEGRKAYQQLPFWRKQYFFNAYIPAIGEFYSVPKGLFGVLFGSTVETGLDAMNDFNPAVSQDLFRYMLLPTIKEFTGPVLPMTDKGELLPPTWVAPQMMKPAFEAWLNTKLYSGKDITPSWIVDQGLEKGLQYTDHVPETYKSLGKAIPIWNAQEWRHIIEGYTGGVGRQIMQGGELAAEKLGLKEETPGKTFLGERAFTRAFIAAPPRGRLSLAGQEFYDTIKELQGVEDNYKKEANDATPDQQMKILQKRTGFVELAKGERSYNPKTIDFLFQVQNSKKINSVRQVFNFTMDINKKFREKRPPFDSDVFTTMSKEKRNTISKQINDLVLDEAINFMKTYRKSHKDSKAAGQPVMADYKIGTTMTIFINMMNKNSMQDMDATTFTRVMKEVFGRPVPKP